VQDKIYKFIIAFIKRHEFIRFAIVGSSGFLLDFFILVFLVEIAQVHYLAAATCGFIAATIFNYIFNKKWTFKDNSSRYIRQYAIFLIISIVGLGINNGVLYIGVEIFGIYYIFTKIVATLLVALWNFFMNKFITFKKHVHA
jgi:putative flippase GtrA